MHIRPFPWKSLLLAPLASIPALTLAALGSSDAGFGSDFGWGIFFALVLAVPISFLFMLLVGVPVFLILRRYKYVLLAVTCALGFAVPFLMFFGNAPFRTTLGAVSSGISVAVAAYLLRPRSTGFRSLPVTRGKTTLGDVQHKFFTWARFTNRQSIEKIGSAEVLSLANPYVEVRPEADGRDTR